jgi:hypothetical protein
MGDVDLDVRRSRRVDVDGSWLRCAADGGKSDHTGDDRDRGAYGGYLRKVSLEVRARLGGVWTVGVNGWFFGHVSLAQLGENGAR